jgi:hypothetical protein
VADGGRAVDAGDDADEVARAGTAVGASISHEGAGAVGLSSCTASLGGTTGRPGPEDQIVRMNMLAGCDVLRRATNCLGVFDHGRAGGDRLDRHLVARLDQCRGDAPPGSTVPISMRPLATATLSAGDRRMLFEAFTAVSWGSWDARAD